MCAAFTFRSPASPRFARLRSLRTATRGVKEGTERSGRNHREQQRKYTHDQQDQGHDRKSNKDLLHLTATLASGAARVRFGAESTNVAKVVLCLGPFEGVNTFIKMLINRRDSLIID